MANQTETRVPTIDTSVTEGGSLLLKFSNGKQLILNPNDLTPDIKRVAMLHGFKQKLVDAAAISRNPETGRSATVDDKYAAVSEVYDRLLSGSWNAPREGGSGAGSLLYKALCRMYADKTPDAIKTWLDAKTDAEKVALRKNPKVAAIILDIQAENAKTDGIDTDALLAGLE